MIQRFTVEESEEILEQLEAIAEEWAEDPTLNLVKGTTYPEWLDMIVAYKRQSADHAIAQTELIIAEAAMEMATKQVYASALDLDQTFQGLLRDICEQCGADSPTYQTACRLYPFAPYQVGSIKRKEIDARAESAKRLIQYISGDAAVAPHMPPDLATDTPTTVES